MATVEDLFIDDDGSLDKPKFRGGMDNWLDNRNWESDSGHSYRKPAGGSKRHTLATLWHDYMSWIKRQMDSNPFDVFKEHDIVDESRKTFYARCENDSVFKKKVERVALEGKIKDAEGSVSEDTDGEDVESDVSGKYSKLYDVGIVTEDLEPNIKTIKGTMLSFSDDVEEIVGTQSDVDIRQLRGAYNKWMRDTIGQDWMVFIQEKYSYDRMQYHIESMYENNDKFQNRVKKKWTVEEKDTDQGNSDRETEDRWKKYEERSEEEHESSEDADSSLSRKSDGKEKGSKKSNKRSSSGKATLGSYSEEYGSVDKVDVQPNKQKSVQDSFGGNKDRSSNYSNVGRESDLKRNDLYVGNSYDVAVKLPEESIDTLITSTPYYNLRDYDDADGAVIGGDVDCEHEWVGDWCDKCDAWYGQLGDEPKAEHFVDHIADLFDRLKPALKQSGSVWLNIGDSYAQRDTNDRVSVKKGGMMSIPDRVDMEMQRRGWIRKQKVIWVKRIVDEDDDLMGNGMPFGSDNRMSYSWEPIYWYVKNNDKYFKDVNGARVMPTTFDGELDRTTGNGKFRDAEDTDKGIEEDTVRGKSYNEMGVNIPDVWLINTGGFDGDHRAVFPEYLPHRPIKITCPNKVCSRCGRPYDVERETQDHVIAAGGDTVNHVKRCNCREENTQSGVVFDPFMGSGTTGKAAVEMGRDWSGIEISQKYKDIALDRIPETKQMKLNFSG